MGEGEGSHSVAFKPEYIIPNLEDQVFLAFLKPQAHSENSGDFWSL